mmetsp:Transcript_953/g.2389  ORF Transcript_953/g.2389 Transcript_953/m.2389 type:complete len:158 (+) Transcript_953:86-559(+)|eukprot:CAMPEP_0117536004 /NCGR_PEP_ID=MMETSP0784-20121206/41226_1 /TAXON_ID=39447 /ORGANISM="" /LENGTH=157 /DNA_ID=CAMNT_0005332547 /DNA_START=19 /DNA_END=492 /DNA_ORIENTATION=+
MASADEQKKAKEQPEITVEIPPLTVKTSFKLAAGPEWKKRKVIEALFEKIKGGEGVELICDGLGGRILDGDATVESLGLGAPKILPGVYRAGSRVLTVQKNGSYMLEYVQEECSFKRTDATGTITGGTDFGSKKLKFEGGKVFFSDFRRWIELKLIK